MPSLPRRGTSPPITIPNQREHCRHRDRFPERVVDAWHKRIERQRDQIAVAREHHRATRMSRRDHVEHPHDPRLRLATRLSAHWRVIEVFPRALEMRSPIRQIDRRQQTLAEILDGFDSEPARCAIGSIV